MSPTLPGSIVPVSDAELASIVGNSDESPDLVAEAPMVAPLGGGSAEAYKLTSGARNTATIEPDSFVLKARMQKHIRRAKLSVRQKKREADVAGFERDKKLHPHMLGDEIKSLGQLFDEYADESATGELYLDRRAVKHILDEALEFLYGKLDMDRSGTLDKAEVKHLLESLGTPTTHAEMDQVMAELDSSGDDTVDFQEFKNWWERRQYETREHQDRELDDLFATVDKDHSGQIDWAEFLQLIACVQLQSHLNYHRFCAPL